LRHTLELRALGLTDACQGDGLALVGGTQPLCEFLPVALQLFCECLSDFFKLPLVQVLEVLHSGIRRSTNLIKRSLVGLSQLLELGQQGVKLSVLYSCHAGQGRERRLVEQLEACRQFFTRLPRRSVRLLAGRPEFIAQHLSGAAAS
jgi:hypothetical protein